MRADVDARKAEGRERKKRRSSKSRLPEAVPGTGGDAWPKIPRGRSRAKVLTARREERLQALKQELETLRGKVVFVIGDARQESTAVHTVKAATEELGRIDFLINKAGEGNYKNLVDTSAEDYDELMDMECAFDFSFHAANRPRDADVLMDKSVH